LTICKAEEIGSEGLCPAIVRRRIHTTKHHVPWVVNGVMSIVRGTLGQSAPSRLLSFWNSTTASDSLVVRGLLSWKNLAAELQRRAKRALIAGSYDSFRVSRPKWMPLKPIGTTPPIIVPRRKCQRLYSSPVSVQNVCIWRDP
jgi:hypothetical protein